MIRIPRRAALGLLLPASALAQADTRPVRLIVTVAPGGAVDLTARLLAQHMAGPLGRPVLVENRPGANGVLAAELVAKSAPDGTTLLVAPREVFGVNPVLYAPLPYDAERGFAPIGIATTGHYVLVANAGLGVTTLAELVTLARRRELAYGSTGVGSMPHLNMEAFARDAGIRLLHVPYRGTGPAATATVAGDVALLVTTAQSVAALVQEGRLVALAAGSPTRLAQFPAVPTLAEAGIAPNSLMPNYFALAAPAGTPPAVVARLNAAMRQALAVPETGERLRAGGLDPAPGSPEELATTIVADIRHFGELIRAAGITRE
ncbi:Bug family tripartite tricarboxylate transporter substrate binding protein [Falsiroseomonas sp. HW251]|uniref:Bug family tripartite tricarboxylate transporter substrate binding protein n=1 Tax=Falsiroseomonas sp. HW251 TaxID=3390998 RepID=UPI003D30FE13